MILNRYIQEQIESNIGKQKVLLLYGSRRTGKTTIIEDIHQKHSENSLLLFGEDYQVSEILQERTITNYKQIIGNKKLIIIDEAQAIPNIGKILKLMIDQIKDITIIATGSSSFELVNEAGEPLVGRNKEFLLYPCAQIEYAKTENKIETLQRLEERLIFGNYPELLQISDWGEKEDYLKSLISSYLLKDILTYTNIKGSDTLLKLLKLLAYQVGSLVSTVELGNSLQISKDTVERYLNLLSKVFIIFPLSGFSQNLRKEVSKSKKWYFVDNGIRNALINNFSTSQFRTDMGQLWEQYFITERMKFNASIKYRPQYYFWRTYDGQEIDFIEQNSRQELSGFECKWGSGKTKTPIAFAKAYPEAKWQQMNKMNYLDWIQ